MRPPRLSIRGLMVGVFGIAFYLMALRFSTPSMASAVILLTIFGLGLAILAAVYRRESRRAFWIGFALMGCGYLGLSSGSWTLTEKESELDGFGVVFSGVHGGKKPLSIFENWLGTTSLLDVLCHSVQAGNGGSGLPSNQTASVFGGWDGRSNAVHSALKTPIQMPFARETPLEEVLAYIKKATIGKDLPKGIPIYVDPLGLQGAEKSMASPITLDLDGVPLNKSLTLILRQLELEYVVDDGLITITSVYSDSRVADRVESFRRVGHSVLAVLFGLIGGFAARVLHATREPSSPSITTSTPR